MKRACEVCELMTLWLVAFDLFLCSFSFFCVESGNDEIVLITHTACLLVEPELGSLGTEVGMFLFGGGQLGSERS